MEMTEKFCKCPYVLCQYHGNCRACMAHNIQDRSLCYCMEEIAEEKGAVLPVNPPRTRVCDSERELSLYCAGIVRETLDKKPDALLCFAAGMSIEGTCIALKEMQDRGEIDFSKARFVSLDEWLDLEDESENCTNFLRKRLYGPLDIREEQMVLFNTHAEDLAQECKRIDDFIFDRGHIDLMLLGIGMNGHLGLNEPGDDFNAYSKVVKLSETTSSVGQKYFTGGMKLTKGITLGMRHIFEAKKVVLQISGQHKRKITNKLLHTRPTEDMPASALALMDQAEIVVTKDAL